MKKADLGFSLLMLFCTNAYAELIQILHTNDLHSHMEHAVHRPELGGYGRIKVLIDKYRKEAQSQGIGTIAMDGGDFLEGTLYYMANKGKTSAEAFNKIGYDVAVLGNHDYLMAADDLEGLLQDVPPSYGLLAANFKLGKNYPKTNEHVKPVWETVINGVKVGVIGITLNDMLFKWRLKGNHSITKEADAARKWAKYLRGRGNEIIIALTHIGLKKDKKLAKSVPELDMIVGGHSHTDLHNVVYQTTSNGKKIPIVQAGKFGEWIGRVLLDYNKDTKKLKVLSYNLNPTINANKDPEIENLIAKANQELNDLYGERWLTEVVGRSFLNPVNIQKDEKIWNFFINDSMLEETHSDFAVHTTSLSGSNYPIGDVTRRSLFDGNPRAFDFKDKYGYNVYTAKVSGILIKILATACLNLNIPLYFSGITFQWKKKSNGKYFVWDVKHKGKKIKWARRYKVAFSEAIVRGGLSISKLVGLILHNGKRTDSSMWEAMENKFRREGDLYPDYLDRYYRREFGLALIGDGREMERVMVVPSEE